MKVDKKYLDLLEEFQTFDHKHGERKLFNHLVGTYDLLRSWNIKEDVCLAGLFHSIYGTEFHKQAAAGSDQRETIKSAIGARAEFLAYIFCACRRFEIFSNFGSETFLVTERFQNNHVTLASNDLRDLLVLEAANLTEQTEYFEYLSPSVGIKYLETYKKAEFLLPKEVNKVMHFFFEKAHPNALIRPTMYGDIPTLKEKIESGFPLDEFRSDQRAATALMYAVVYKQLEAAEILLANGADAKIPDKFKNLPIDIAKENKDQAMYDLLSRYQ